MQSIYDLGVLGGGAAGIFGAIAAKEAAPHLQVVLFEKSGVLLSKVRVSGGGRCNVTHACFDPKKLIQHYPRGGRELLGPLHRFQPKDTIAWFEERGVKLKTEEDGRIFPVTDSSETIIRCLLTEAQKLGVEIYTHKRPQMVSKAEEGFRLEFPEPLLCKNLLLATGSSKEGYAWATSLGHSIQEPVPSLFTLNVPTSPLKELSGVAVDPVRLRIAETSLVQEGALLITHFGFSGPAALKLSAWGARAFYEKAYNVDLYVHWVPLFSEEEVFQKLLRCKREEAHKNLLADNPFSLPKNLWRVLVASEEKRLADVSHAQLKGLAAKLCADRYRVEGKTTHKEEFVTCGGVALKEVDFKTMQSKICPDLFFAGEILDIDGVTGGFNFQNAWTTAYIAGASQEYGKGV
jgi:predicted Rossmann fold flavoprotein